MPRAGAPFPALPDEIQASPTQQSRHADMCLLDASPAPKGLHSLRITLFSTKGEANTGPTRFPWLRSLAQQCVLAPAAELGKILSKACEPAAGEPPEPGSLSERRLCLVLFSCHRSSEVPHSRALPIMQQTLSTQQR